MSLQPYDIRLIDLVLGKADYIRPGIILTPPVEGKVKVAVTSTKWEKMEDQWDFSIRRSHECFAATGLNEECYVVSALQEVAVSDVKSRIGKLEGRLLEEFKDWLSQHRTFTGDV